MTAWMIETVVLAVGGVGPAILLAARGRPVQRLVGLQVGTVSVTVLLMLFAQSQHQSSYLIVPLVLVVLSFVGTLVFTRLTGPKP